MSPSFTDNLQHNAALQETRLCQAMRHAHDFDDIAKRAEGHAQWKERRTILLIYCNQAIIRVQGWAEDDQTAGRFGLFVLTSTFIDIYHLFRANQMRQFTKAIPSWQRMLLWTLPELCCAVFDLDIRAAWLAWSAGASVIWWRTAHA